jgi:hypothetical protein
MVHIPTSQREVARTSREGRVSSVFLDCQTTKGIAGRNRKTSKEITRMRPFHRPGAENAPNVKKAARCGKRAEIESDKTPQTVI